MNPPEISRNLARPRDATILRLWLHGRSPETQRAYLHDVAELLAGRAIGSVTLGDLQDYQDALSAAGAAPATIARRLSALKSLLSFAHRTGAIPLDVGQALRLPAVRSELAARILSEADVLRILSRLDAPRDAALVRTLYAAALRVSEAAGLRKRDVQAHGQGGVLAVWGKGSRSRVVRISPASFAALVRVLPQDPNARVFGLSMRQIRRIVRRAGEAAGLEGISPHWLRHAHASHALDRGCPIHLVQQTLGHRSVQTTGQYLHARPSESSGLFLAV